MGRMLRHCGVTCALALLVGAPTASAARTATVPARRLVARMLAGRPVILSDRTVAGRLDLGAGANIRAAFKCRGCTFEGGVRAGDATFERTFDVTGSTFRESADFSSATFQGPALFRESLDDNGMTKNRLEFKRHADFSLTVFDDLASFSGALLDGRGDFQDARFSEVTFAHAEFGDRASFDRASFRGFAGFGDTEFDEPVSFQSADFRDRTDFGVARFDTGGDFSAAQFAQGASFLGAEFTAPVPKKGEGEQEAASFNSVASAGSLDFTFAKFISKSRKTGVIALFDDVVCSRSLIFRKTQFADEDSLSMTRLQASDLVLDVGVVRQVGSHRRDVLKSIEDSAKARDDLAVANNAEYELRVLESKRYGFPWHQLDYVFFRGVAGYFVRPFRPLLVLVILASLVAIGRYAYERGGRARERAAAALRLGRWQSAGRQCGDFLTCLLDAFALAGPRWRASREGPIALGDRVQAIAYRLLLVCAIIGLANSNPTLRKMVDTLL